MKKRGEKSTSNKSKRDFLWWALRVSFVVVVVFFTIFILKSSFFFGHLLLGLLFIILLSFNIVVSVICLGRYKERIFAIISLIVSTILTFLVLSYVQPM